MEREAWLSFRMCSLMKVWEDDALQCEKNQAVGVVLR